MTPQRPAAPETETDANGLTEAEREAIGVHEAIVVSEDVYAAVERIVAERVRVVEGERECPTCGPTTTEPHPRRQGVSRCANCKEWLTTNPKCEGLAPFRCNNPHCLAHGERIDPAELDAARLVGDIAEAEVVALTARAESAEAAHEAEKAAHERLRAELLLDRVRREEGAKVLREAADAARCGGCKGQGAHRRHCPRHPSYHPWIPLADHAESIGDSIGVPELANRAWQLAGAIRAEMPNHPYRAASVGRGEGL